MREASLRTVSLTMKELSSGMSLEAKVNDGVPEPPLRALLELSTALMFATLIPLRPVTE